jgi:signal transduction histidine kinase
VGSGTGLGRFVCHGVVTELGGEPHAEREVGAKRLAALVAAVGEDRG